MTERFQYYLQDVSRISGQRINGIVVCDHRAPNDDRRLQELHGKLLRGQHDAHSNYANLVEGVFIAPSHLSVGIQFADMGGGAVLRRYKADDSRFFDQIADTFRKSEDGRIEGFRPDHVSEKEGVTSCRGFPQSCKATQSRRGTKLQNFRKRCNIVF